MASTTSKAVGRIYAYAQDALAGRIIVCDKVRRACERFERDLKRSREDPRYPWRFDEELAARPIEFMEKFLRPTKGDYERMTLLPWQCFVEGNLYGWVDRDTGLRRYREAMIIMGRGNGKSTMVAGNATFGACKDGERGADIYLLANSKEQAGTVFDECRRQILTSPALAARFRPLRDGVYYDGMQATIKSRSSDSRKLDGLNPHLAIFDEIHEYKEFKLINVIRRGMKKRRQPLTIYITTMGTVLDGALTQLYHLFSDALDEGILEAEVADRMFAFICELDAGDDVDDETAWVKANPSLGTLLSLDDLREDWQRSKLTPAEKADFITKQLDVAVDSSEAAYLPIEIINRNREIIRLEDMAGKAFYAGYDLSSREDFTAACLLAPLGDRRWFVIHHSWTTKRKVELDNEKIDYYAYAMQGILDICEGEYIRQETVLEWFKRMAETYEITCIGYDPANAQWLNMALEAEGFQTKIVRQGPITLNDPMKSFREAMIDGRIVSNDDPMLRWYMHNVKLRNNFQDREKENWVPTKTNRYRKIDGFMALLDAWTVAQEYEAPQAAQEASIEIVKLDFGRRKSGGLRYGAV